MSELDDRLDREVRRLAGEVDGARAFDRVAGLKRRRRAIRWTQQAALTAAIVVGSAAGAFALARAFDVGRSTPSDRPVPAPTTTPSGEHGGCPNIRRAVEELPDTYGPVGEPRTGDVDGDGAADRVSLAGDEDRPPRCRYYVVVEHTGGRAFMAPVIPFEWLPVPPTIFTIAEIDGQPGLEIVVEFGGPGHPHRTGRVFTFFPEADFRAGAVLEMVLDPSGTGPDAGFPLHGEFPAAVDCTAPGRIVVTTSEFAPGGDDSVYGIIRTFYRAEGNFLEVREETFIVEVGTEDERWPELADDSFRSCPGA